MEKPRRHELQKMYEDLADEVLMEIARNMNQEYEKVAVEVAKTELDRRGVDIPDVDKERAGSLQWFGEKLSSPFIEIPRFSIEESAAIEELFIENKLPYEKRAVTIAVGPAGGSREYVFYVQKDSFPSAIELLKEYYMSGIEEQSSSLFSGTCPACGTKLAHVEKCTDCGLSLAGDYSESLENHPFIKFLKRNGLMM